MSYNTVGVVPINSYIEAVTRYQGIQPIRGKDIRPLGARRYHSRSNIVVAENRVFLNYYGKAFVEWYPDDTFIVHPPVYNSAFMVGDLSPYLPFNIGVSWDKGRYVLTIRSKDGLSKYFLDQPLQFKPAPNGDRYTAQFELAEKPSAYHTRLRPHAYKKYMAEFDPFFAWCELVQDFENKNSNITQEGKEVQGALREACGLPASDAWWDQFASETNKLDWSHPDKQKMQSDHAMHDMLPRGGRWKAHEFHTPSCKVLLDWLKDTSGKDWVKARTVIITQAGHYDFKAGGMVITTKIAKDFLRELVLHVHSDECFKRTKTKDGEVPTKRNAEYFSSYVFSMEKPLAQG